MNTAISLSEYQERQEAESREAAARMLDIQQSAKTAAEAALKMQAKAARVQPAPDLGICPPPAPWPQTRALAPARTWPGP